MWNIKIHKLVLEEDFKKLDNHQKEYIIKTIKKKLSLEPDKFGEPLIGEYKGYWKLPVGDYRVVYKIIKNEVVVFVIKIGIRRDNIVYEELFSRIKKISEKGGS